MSNKILIGPAGTGGAEVENFEELVKKGLDAVEIEFTYGVWMKKEQAEKVREANKKFKLKLSIHASYFINLNSTEKQKIGASRARILQACEIGNLISNGEKIPIVFHPGFYQKDSKETTYKNIKEQMLKIQEIINERKLKVYLCPETTGKPSQFGDLDEIIQLMKETGCHICVDFAHLKARYNGTIDYDAVMKKIEHVKDLHAHFSGIEYTPKGERRHLITTEAEIKELFKYLNKYKINLTIINESPQPMEDALKMKNLL
jgi:deoxyribonuclease-4